MVTPLLATKFYIPPPGKNLIPRPRLDEKMDQGLSSGCRLILVSAPAGYGKTTLVSTWVSHLKLKYHPPPLIAWLSLDGGDNDPSVFWSYIISSLRAQHEWVGEKDQILLQASSPHGLEVSLAPLVNELSQIPNPFFLILDDFHIIRNPLIHQSLSFFIDHLPPQFHILILSRIDPPLQLALLRGRGQLLEIRSEELRFSNNEASSLLNEAMGLALSPNAIDTLNAKAEGWAAGLQMAALSMQGRSDTNQFIQSFSGSNRYILDYLVEEVLKRQPAPVQDFLVRTSILDIFCSSLCDILTNDTDLKNSPNSQSVLEYLESSSLFTFPMDDDRHWYRFHHLFADLLRNRLQQSLPNEISGLHSKASRWYEQNGLIIRAIEHSLLAKDYERAISLINQSAEQIIGYGDRAAMAQWIDAIPEDQLRKNLNLEVLRAASLSMDGHIREAEICLQNMEKWLSPVENPDIQQTILEGRILTVRSNIASYRDDPDGILLYAPQALEKLAEDKDLTWRSWNLVNLGNANLNKGDLEATRRYLADGVVAARATHSPDMTLTTLFYYIMILWFMGNIRKASLACQEGLEYISENHLDELPRAGALLMICGLILCEKHELGSAEEMINKGYRLILREKSPLWLELANLIRLRYLIASDDLMAADRVAGEAINLYTQYEIPKSLAAWVRGFITWLWILQRNFKELERDFQDFKISLEGEVYYPIFGEYLSLARFCQVKGDYLSSITLLEQIISRVEKENQFFYAISAYILLALAYQARADIPRALNALGKAFNTTEPEGSMQLYLNEGEPMIGLLEVASQKGMNSNFANQLLNLLPSSSSRILAEKYAQRQNLKMIEPLTSREMEVVRFIAEGYSNKEIAQAMDISLRTVKFYGTNIYSKLGVTGRTQAIHKAKELGLL